MRRHPHTVVLFSAAVGIVILMAGCLWNQDSQETQSAPPTICDIIPRKAIAQLLGAPETYFWGGDNNLADEGQTYYRCTLSTESLEPPSGRVVFIYLRPDDDDSEIETINGVEIVTPLGKGSVAPRRAYVYPYCNGEKYFLDVHATEEVGHGDRAAVQEIALAVVHALDEAQGCRESSTGVSTGSPASRSPDGSSPAA